ncbi:NUDIX domain-containing protein [Polymorphum gilvum]|nr:NUDIX domain-containing protein [Polymorphum gilvum]
MLRLLSILPPSWTRSIVHAASLARNPHTLGVRALVQDREERILLVRHRYLPGWYLPGGGVDVGETMAEAVQRELAEETGVQTLSPPELVSVYHNRETTRRDHVALFRIPTWEQHDPLPIPNAEIAEIGFFPIASPPAEATAATVRRLDELRGRAAVSPHW